MKTLYDFSSSNDWRSCGEVLVRQKRYERGRFLRLFRGQCPSLGESSLVLPETNSMALAAVLQGLPQGLGWGSLKKRRRGK